MQIVPAKAVSKRRVKCNICGRMMKGCVKYYGSEIESAINNNDKELTSNMNVTDKDWICVICSSEYFGSKYAIEGSYG